MTLRFVVYVVCLWIFGVCVHDHKHILGICLLGVYLLQHEGSIDNGKTDDEDESGHHSTSESRTNIVSGERQEKRTDENSLTKKVCIICVFHYKICPKFNTLINLWLHNVRLPPRETGKGISQ